MLRVKTIDMGNPLMPLGVARPKVARGGGLGAPVKVNYPAMTILRDARVRLLNFDEMKKHNWTSADLDGILQKAGRMLCKTSEMTNGRFVPSLYFAAPESGEPKEIVSVDPQTQGLYINCINGRSKEETVAKIERAICEGIGVSLMHFSPFASLSVSDPENFFRGVENPFLAGIKIELHHEVSDVLSQRTVVKAANADGAEARIIVDANPIKRLRFLIVANAFAILSSKVVFLLSQVPLTREEVERREEECLRVCEGDIAKAQNKDSIFEIAVALASEAAIAEICGFDDLSKALAARLVRHFVPQAAQNNAALSLKGQIDERRYYKLIDDEKRYLEKQAGTLFFRLKEEYLRFYDQIGFRKAG